LNFTDRCRRDVQAHAEAVRRFFESPAAAELERAAGLLASALAKGGKILFFGNGGSAADAQHLAAELVNRMGRTRRALAALALTTDSSVLTSIANDSAFEQIFARQLEALGRPGDVAVAVSTSGNSPSILEGLRRARALGLPTVGLLGKDGGKARTICDHPVVVPDGVTARIQEVHILIGHLICEEVESLLIPLPDGNPS
jgi:D-sedoheptulose 7-phosphate isomerase